MRRVLSLQLALARERTGISRKGFLPLPTAFRTPSASSRSWPRSSSTAHPCARPLLLLLRFGARLRFHLRLGLRLARLLRQRLLLFLHLRGRDLVRHLQELLLDGARLAARDPPDGRRDLFYVQLEDAASLGLVVGGLA